MRKAAYPYKRLRFAIILPIAVSQASIANETAISGQVAIENQRAGGVVSRILSVGGNIENIFKNGASLSTQNFWLHNKETDVFHAGLNYRTPFLNKNGSLIINASHSNSGQQPKFFAFNKPLSETSALSLSYSYDLSSLSLFGSITYARSQAFSQRSRTAVTDAWAGRFGVNYSHQYTKGAISDITVTLVGDTSKTTLNQISASQQNIINTAYFIDINLTHTQPLTNSLNIQLDGDFRFSPKGACTANTSIFGHHMHNTPATGFECASIAAELEHKWGAGKWDISSYAFIDYGEVINKSSVTDVGIGFRFSLFNNIRGHIEYVHALSGAKNNGDNIDFGITIPF